MTNLIGQVLKNRYRVEAYLGRGGMAEVYRAFDTRRSYPVAIKVMHADLAEDIEFLRRFHREAESLSRLAHDNIVRFYELQRAGHLAFLVMDFVEGITLRRRLLDVNGPLSLEEVLSITRQVCSALHYAHEEGIIHRDVKPDNIMLRSDGQALVTDFGIAKAVDATTITVYVPGTPAYMSPEQGRGQIVDWRSDIYSLGIVVYEMVLGRRPSGRELAPQIVTGRLQEQIDLDPTLARKGNLTWSSQAEAVILKAVAKKREDRWPSALDFWQAFAEALGASRPAAVVTPVAASPPLLTLPHTVVESAFRPNRLVSIFSNISGALAGVLLVGLFVAVVILTLIWTQPPRATTPTGPNVTVSVGLSSTFTSVAIRTAQVAATATSVPPPTATPTKTPRLTPTPVPTPTRLPPTLRPTPTILANPSLTSKTDLNVRAGPGIQYEIIGSLPAGAEAAIIGRDENRQWWQIDFSRAVGDFGWVASNPTYSTNANTERVPVVKVSPPPTSTPTRLIPTSTSTPVPTFRPTATKVLQCNPGEWTGCGGRPPAITCKYNYVSECQPDGQWGQCIWDPGACGGPDQP